MGLASGFRSVTRRGVIVAAALAVLLPASTVSAAGGVRQDFVGPLTGRQYTYRYNCLTGASNLVSRSATTVGRGSVRVVIDRGGDITQSAATFPNTEQGLVWITNFASVWLVPDDGTGSYTIFEGPYTTNPLRQPESFWTEVARGTFACEVPEQRPVGRFVPITPTRALDTRPGSAINYSGAKPGPGATVNIPRSALPNIPNGAIAVSLQITAADATNPGFVSVLPTGTTPGQTSNLNLAYPGQRLANAAIVKLGTDGGISAFTQNGTHLVVDINGYFVTTPAQSTDGRFQQITPTRVLDTRQTSPINYTGPQPGDATKVDIDIPATTPIPTGKATAVAINVTSANATNPGFIQVAAADTLVPGASSVINPPGARTPVAGFTIVPINPQGRISVYTDHASDLIVDVLGWFTNTTNPPSRTGLYTPVDPDRLLDTRPATITGCCTSDDEAAFTKIQPAQSTSPIGVGVLNSFASGVFLNVTATNTLGRGFVQVGPSGQTPGATSTVNFSGPGQTVANAAIGQMVPVRGYGRSPDWYYSSGGHLVIDISGYFLME